MDTTSARNNIYTIGILSTPERAQGISSNGDDQKPRRESVFGEDQETCGIKVNRPCHFAAMLERACIQAISPGARS